METFKQIVFSVLLFASSGALALEVCWDAPTENVDGSLITDLPLVYVLHWAVGEDYVPLSRNYTETRAINLDDMYPGETTGWCTTINSGTGVHHMALTAIDSALDQSDYSNEVAKMGDATTPLPPIIIESSRAVYTVIKQPDVFVLLPIGTVPAGTPCDPNNTVNGRGAVPNSAVIWTSPTGSRPIVVVAECNG